LFIDDQGDVVALAWDDGGLGSTGVAHHDIVAGPACDGSGTAAVVRASNQIVRDDGEVVFGGSILAAIGGAARIAHLETE
jgi:hypothetical protein